MEQLVFLGCQGHRLAFVADLLCTGIQADTGVLDQRLSTPGATPKQRTYARLQLCQVERLDQVVVGAGIQAGDAVFGGIARGQDQHRQIGTAVTQAPEHFETVHAWQAKVEHRQIEDFTAQRVQGAVAVLQPVDGITFTAEGLMNALAERHVVLYE
ncbi:hypothetical protein D3C78_1075160 [compost metagenome]